ncbi:hypothetical protein [Halococcus thailandensis]|uniref:hypothetical protein n=1 Tax=Halococcus thailandensis TaxID=335952 RepID=UPI00126836A6|nr:hypothetical protein [Halococcus thailandensis]
MDRLYYREKKGEQIYVSQSADELPSHMDIGILKNDGFDQKQEGVRSDIATSEFSRMEDNFEEQDDVFVARDQESGQLYDLSEIDTNQQPTGRDYEREERAKGSARDVKNARERSND